MCVTDLASYRKRRDTHHLPDLPLLQPGSELGRVPGYTVPSATRRTSPLVTGTRVGSFNAPACTRHLIGIGLFGEPLPLHTVRSQPRTSPSVRRCKKSPEPQTGLVTTSNFHNISNLIAPCPLEDKEELNHLVARQPTHQPRNNSCSSCNNNKHS